MNRRMNLAVEDITMQDVQHIGDKSSMAVYTTGCTKGVRTVIEEKNWTARPNEDIISKTGDWSGFDRVLPNSR
jgi:hypothetical protein